MSRRTWTIIAAVTAILAVVGAVWWQGRDADVEATDAPETSIVERGTLMDTVAGTGALEPQQAVNLSFAAGVVTEVLVAEGDSVVEGQPLAVLDTRELAMSLASAESDLVASESNFASTQRSHETLVAGASETDIAAARLDVEQAKDSLWGRQASRDGVCGRVAAGRGQQYECDSSEASVLQGEGAVRSAELRYDEVLAGATDDEIAASSAKLASAESQLLAARTKVDQARIKLEQATLTSSIAGTVTALNLVAGETAGASGVAATIANLDDLNVVIQLDETDVASIDVGMAAEVTLDAFPDDTFGGEVVAIAPTGASQSGVVLFPVTVSVHPDGVAARPGMTAEVEIVTQFVEDALIVPLRAVNSTPRGSFVLRVAADGEPAGEGFDGAFGGSGQRPVGGAVGNRQGRPPGGAAGGGERPFREGGAFGDGAGSFQPPEGMSDAMAQIAEAGGVPTFVEVGMTTATEAEILSGLEAGDVVLVPTSALANDFARPGGGIGLGGMFRGRP